MKNTNRNEQTSYKPLFFGGALLLVGIVVTVALTLGSSQKTVPKITLSYFKDKNEFAESIEKILHLQISQKKYFWIGIEPENEPHFNLAIGLKKELEKNIGAFDLIILDKELAVPVELIKELGPVQMKSVKDDFSEVSELIKINADKKILIVTASIYSTNFLKQNPVTKINELTLLKPMTFSMGHFAQDLDDEKNNLFRCDTEDKTGIADWGCAVINKARTVRRKINKNKLKENPSLTIGLMDLTGETDYMILVGQTKTTVF